MNVRRGSPARTSVGAASVPVALTKAPASSRASADVRQEDRLVRTTLDLRGLVLGHLDLVRLLVVPFARDLVSRSGHRLSPSVVRDFTSVSECLARSHGIRAAFDQLGLVLS